MIIKNVKLNDKHAAFFVFVFYIFYLRFRGGLGGGGGRMMFSGECMEDCGKDMGY